MFQLSNLSSLVKKRKRVGRGGKRGGTSGKGHKGQKARSGHHGTPAGFEGGQMPLVRRLPKRGFKNLFTIEYSIVNLSTLDRLFDADAEVSRTSLVEKGLLKKSDKAPLKILGAGQLTKKLIVHADALSASAQKAIEDLGGKVHITKEK